MFCPLPRDSVLQSHANDVSPSHGRLLPIPNAERRHHHNFRCPAMRIFFFKKGGERSKSERGGGKNTAMMLKLFHVTQGLLHPHHPRHRWLTEDGQSELLCLGSSTDAPTAVRTSCVRWRSADRERKGEEKPVKERETGGKRGNKAPWWPEMGKAFISITCISIATTPHPGPCLL